MVFEQIILQKYIMGWMLNSKVECYARVTNKDGRMRKEVPGKAD